VPRPESSPDHASLGTKTVYSESAAHATLAKPLPPGVHPAGVQYRMLTYSGGKSLSLSVQTRRGSTRWEACAAEGQGGRSPAPVRKPGKGVGGVLGLVRHLEVPLPRAAAAGVLEQQQPALLPCVAAAVARGCSSAEQSLGSAEGLEPSAPSWVRSTHRPGRSRTKPSGDASNLHHLRRPGRRGGVGRQHSSARALHDPV